MTLGPSTWTEISLNDLFFAFRKAKADCFFETSVRVAEKFVAFEEAIGDRLSQLLVRLQSGEITDVLLEGLGEPAIFPKKVSADGLRDRNSPHAFFSDAKRAFQSEKKLGLVPEFRMIGDFSVEVHVLSALWVNLVGHKFDSQLGPSALASRLRRYRREPSGRGRGDYHIEAIGSFEPYFEPYRQWRDSGLEAIKESLKRDEGVVAITLDVGNFYHRIDPRFAVHPSFHEYAGIELSEFEVLFTKQIVDALVVWSGTCASKVADFGCHGSTFGGLPIGLSVVRVLSNVILMYLDREIESSLFPIYYARYVDDVFLVIKDNASYESQADVWQTLQLHIPSLTQDQGGIVLSLPSWAGDTRLLFQPEKQKCFFLSGKSGLDLLENIAAQIRDVSSERRLMALPEQLDQTQSARALTSTDSAEEADSLRRADGLTLRRLGWSVLLRSVGVLARDLLPKDWVKERSLFYDFAHEHVIRPDKILEQIDRLPRLFSIPVSLGDWRAALKIWRKTNSALYELQSGTAGGKMKINGHVCESTPQEVWDSTRDQVKRFFREALLRSYPPDQSPSSKAFHALVGDLGFEVEELRAASLSARETDWARMPYKEHLRLHAFRHAPSRPNEDLLYGRYQHETVVRTFLERSAKGSEAQPSERLNVSLCGTPFDSLLPFLFPTRPYTAEEIALYLPTDCVMGDQVEAAHAWAEYTRAMRGVWVRTDLAEDSISFAGRSASNGALPPDRDEGTSSGDPQYIVLQDGEERFPVRIGITSPLILAIRPGPLPPLARRTSPRSVIRQSRRS